MKKAILILLGIGFLSLSATPKTTLYGETSKSDSTFIHESYAACIDACNACATSCTVTQKMGAKMDPVGMARCIQLCKECVAICTASSQLMVLDSESAKTVCRECAVICERCAIECDKFNMAECAKCASDCRKSSKLCNEM